MEARGNTLGSVLRFNSCPKSDSHFETEKGDPENDGTYF